jgi:hypothetical protein
MLPSHYRVIAHAQDEDYKIGNPPFSKYVYTRVYRFGKRERKMATNVDCQGKQRGSCFSCACDGYDGGSEKKKCVACGHPPGKHQNLSTSSSVSSSSGVSSISALSPPSTSTGFFDGGMTYSSNSDSAVFTPNPVYQCRYSGCQKESAFDPNTGAQNEYCHEHNIQYIQMLSRQQDGYNPFTTPRTPQWSIGDSNDFASSPSDSSDNDQDPSSRVQSDDGSLRPTSAAAPPSSLSSSWGLANVFSSLRAPSKIPKPSQHAYVSPRKRTLSATRSLATAHARPVTAPASQQQSIPVVPQATFMQAPQQSISVPQTVIGEVNQMRRVTMPIL